MLTTKRKRIILTLATFSLVLVFMLISSLGIAQRAFGKRMPAPDYLAAIQEDLSKAENTLEPHSPVLELIEAGKLQEAAKMLAFAPLAEAPIPEGFPRFTPVGVIEVKSYPAYRKAVGSGFWPLFMHIKKQKIPMTAPVEMSSATNGMDGAEMAFLYETTAVGKLGDQDSITVEENPPTLVVSLGMRGKRSNKQIEDAKARLLSWLADQTKYDRLAEDSSAFRLYGYNSPMVPNDQKYWEAQMLLKPKAEKALLSQPSSLAGDVKE